jgi:hypothetical protein
MSVGSISGASTSVQASTDPRDLNKDGKVSQAEIEAYERAHPKPKKADAAAAKTAEPEDNSVAEPRLLDVSV